MNYLFPRKMTTQQMELLQKLEMIGNLESVVTEQKIRIEKLRTTYETLKAEHVQLKEVSLIYISLQLTVSLETMGPFAAILPWWNRSFDLQFHPGKTASYRIKNLRFTKVISGWLIKATVKGWTRLGLNRLLLALL